MLELNTQKLVNLTQFERIILLFYTERCPLCPFTIQILDNLEKKNNTVVKFTKINTDIYPEIGKEYTIPGVPTVLSIKDGHMLQFFPGLRNEEQYQQMIDELLNDYENNEGKYEQVNPF